MRKKDESCTEFHKNSYFDELIASFDRYMDSARGLSPSTRKLYCSHARVFLLSLVKEKNCIDLIRPQDVIKFILSFTKVGRPKSAKRITYSLRSFFKFLKQTQRLKGDLADCVPTVAAWKRGTFPISLSVEEVQRLLSSCNKDSKTGVRDFAVLMLLVRLGLRSCEVCRLTLDDVNWDKSEIIIRGKGSTDTQFPIFQDLGNALADYLQYGRPPCSSGSFFICVGQLKRGFQSSSTVRSILRRALIRAGLNPEKKEFTCFVILLRRSYFNKARAFRKLQAFYDTKGSIPQRFMQRSISTN